MSSALRLLTIRVLDKGDDISDGLGRVLKLMVPSFLWLLPPIKARLESTDKRVKLACEFTKSRAPIMLSIVLLFYMIYVP